MLQARNDRKYRNEVAGCAVLVLMAAVLASVMTLILLGALPDWSSGPAARNAGRNHFGRGNDSEDVELFVS
jgi:hypothetical protein